jgi:hypothetical protein
VYLDIGQRAVQGIEDGLALPITLYGASTAEGVEERLRLYEALRRNRASAVLGEEDYSARFCRRGGNHGGQT